MINKFNNKLIIFCLILGVLFFAHIDTFAEEKEDKKDFIEIEADSMDYDYTNDRYHAQGAVVINYKDMHLNADDVNLDNKSKVATAQGNVFLKMAEDYLKGDKVIFNIENQTGVAYEGQVFYDRNHFYVKGDKIEKKGENTYFIEQPRATTCDGESPDWEIAGSEMDVTIEGYGKVKDARFLTKGLPIFYSPFVLFPAKTKRQSGFLLPYLSYSRSKNGVDIEIPFFWAISPQMDATFYQRYMEKRGYKQGVEFRYFWGDHSFGTWYGDFMEDGAHNVEALDTRADREHEGRLRRWSFYINHQTNFSEDFYARADLYKVSDKWYFKDFDSHNYYLDHYARNEEDLFRKIPFKGDESLRLLESTARVYKGWSNYNLTGLVNYTHDFAPATNDATLQKYPEIILTGIKQPLLSTPLYYELKGTYDYFYRAEGHKGHLFDFNPAVSLPIDIGGFMKITPQFELKQTAWMREDNEMVSVNKNGKIVSWGDNKGNGNFTTYTASITASSLLARVFDINMFSWEKIKHEIRPELSYAYTPNVSQDYILDYVPLLKEQNGVTWALTNTLMAKIKADEEIGEDADSSIDTDTDIRRHVDIDQETNTGIDISADTVEDKYTYLEFLRLKVFQTYDINEAKRKIEAIGDKRHPFSDIGIEFDLNPHKYLSFRARNVYDVYSGWKETNYDLSLRDWRNDKIKVGYRYTDSDLATDSIRTVFLSAQAIITDDLVAHYYLSRDQLRARTNDSTIGFTYYSQCWSFGVDYERTHDDERFIIRVSLSGLGEML